MSSTNLEFMHIPKCAGTSIWNLLQEFSGDLQKYHPKHKNLAGFDLNDNTFLFTVIRNPIDRVISFYRFVVNNRSHHLVISNPELYQSSLIYFVSYLKEINNVELSNLITKFMSGRIDKEISWRQAWDNRTLFAHIGFFDRLYVTESWIINFFNRCNGRDFSNRTPVVKHLQKSRQMDIFTQAGYNEAMATIINENTEDIILYHLLSNDLSR